MFAQIEAENPASSPESINDVWEQAKETVDEFISPMDTCAKKETLDLIAPVLIITMIVVFGVMGAYLAGDLLFLPQLKAIAKQEGYEVIVTVLIVVAFISFVGLTNDSIAYDIMGGGSQEQPGIFTKAMDYSNIMVAKISQDITSLALITNFIYMVYSAPFRIGPINLNFRFQIGPMLKPIVDGLVLSSQSLSLALMEWMANSLLLCYVKQWFLPFVLPLGIFMRSIPQTRGAGNALISFAFASFFVYPVLLNISFEAYQLKYGHLLQAGNQSQIQFILDEYVKSNFVGISMFAVFIRNAVLTTGVLFWFSLIEVLMYVFIDTIYTVFILSIFLPAVNFFIYFTVAKEISKFLGTEVNISMFTRLI